MIEAIAMSEKITGEQMDWSYAEKNRTGDHIWWIGDNGHFAEHYPQWTLTRDVGDILTEMYEANAQRWSA